MKRTAWIIVAGTAGLVVSTPMTLRQMGKARVIAAPEVEAEVEQPAAVMVEHEYITLDASPAPVMKISAVSAIARTVAAPPPARPAPRTFTDKAKRAILGDGRYRPEPFPRAR